MPKSFLTSYYIRHSSNGYMHYLYVLKSTDSGKYYIGETSNLERRLNRHKNKMTGFGKINKNIILVYKKKFETRSEAKKAEYFLKKQKSHAFIEKIVNEVYHIPL